MYGVYSRVGEADFAALRKENAYYVDKTEIIYELVHDTKNKVTLFTRPRRFGKTLMMSMMFLLQERAKKMHQRMGTIQRCLMSYMGL